MRNFCSQWKEHCGPHRSVSVGGARHRGKQKMTRRPHALFVAGGIPIYVSNATAATPGNIALIVLCYVRVSRSALYLCT